MPEGETLSGRSGISALFTDCTRRPATGSARALPLVVLLGKRGSGKTWVLKYLRDACSRSVAIPYVFIDCADQPNRPVWRLGCDLVDALHAEKWSEFGHLNFPRVTLARLAAEHPQLPTDRTRAQDELREHVRAPFKQHVAPITTLSQASPTSQHMINLMVGAVRFVTGSTRAVQRLYRTGLQWYGSRFGRSEDSGMSVLVKLNHDFHAGDRRDAERMLCEAFLADLSDAFARGRKFNCVVLLDNCDDPAGTSFLNLLADLRTERSGSGRHDPLVVVAASRSLPGLAGLAEGWTFPWEPERRGTSRVPDPDEVDYGYWHDAHSRGREPASWWFPVHLRDLTLTELHSEHARFVHQLTGGHPWSARKILGLISHDASPARPVEINLRTVLDRFAPQAGYLLGDLPASLRRTLVLWSAARDIDTAASAGIGQEDWSAASTLHDELVTRLWLVADGEPPAVMSPGPRLHPWLRRILLHELAMTLDTWSAVHLQLRDYATKRGDPLAAAYHDLARGELPLVVDYLAEQLHQLDADSWILAFNSVSAAPSTRGAAETAVDHYEALMRERGPLDRQDRVRNTLWSMVVARWIWSDPLGDPMFELTNTIADGYVRLAEDAHTGLARYHREARTYRETRTQ